MKIFRAPATTLTIDFCIVANLTSPFLWLEDIILQSTELANGIDKGQLLGSKNLFSVSFEVVWEILEAKLLQIVSAIFSCKGGGGRRISHWLSIFWTLSKFKLCTPYDSISSIYEVYWLKTFSLGLIFFLFPESLLSSCCFLPVLDATLTGEWSYLTGDSDNSLTGDMLSLTGDVGPFTGDVNVLCFLWDWWQLHLPFQKTNSLSWKWPYSSSDEDSCEDIWES